MPASNSRRRNRSGLKGKTWLWIVIPISLILICGYLLYRNFNISPADVGSFKQEQTPGTELPKPPDLPEPGEPAAETGPGQVEYKLFFGNEDFDSSLADCDDLFPVFRSDVEVEDILFKSLTELLKGPSETERELGYYTSLNPGVRLLGIRREAGTVYADFLLGIRRETGTVYADFSRELEDGVAGSCQTMAIRAQINETLLQFEGVDKVVILVEGNPGNVLQP